MSLGSALNSALSGINVSQQQIDTISNNVSNATNDGYTRKILPQSSQIAGGDVIGAQTENLIRNVDINLQKDIWSQTAKTAGLDTKKSFLNRIQDFHGSPDEETSISAEMSKLRDSFSQLADSPSDSFLQSKVVEQAQTVTKRINDFAGIIKDMRNNAESEMTTSVNNLNEQLTRVAELNQQIKQNVALDKSVASLKDKRDQAIKEVAKEIEISTFERSDGTMVVQTAKGVKLADETAKDVFFEESNLGPNTFYPDGGANGLFVGGDPDDNKTAVDIADNDIGGRIGAALEIRDTIAPRYQAQIDELAHKTALRFENQGLRLFTGDAGTIPPDDPPDRGATPPPPGPTPVQYVGFANNIEVNSAVRNDNSLVQQGTFQPDEAIQKGSTEVIDRIIEFSFGDTALQRAEGEIDLSQGTGDLQEKLGLFSKNEIKSEVDLSRFSEIDSGGTTSNDIATTFDEFLEIGSGAGAEDRFEMTVHDEDGSDSKTFTIDLEDANGNPGANAAEQIVNEINDEFSSAAWSGAGTVDAPNFSASVNTNGQIVFNSRGKVDFNANPADEAMGKQAFKELFGIEAKEYTPEDPSFEIQIGNNDPQKITIEPGDGPSDIVDKINFGGSEGVPGAYAEINGDGELVVRPGTDDSTGSDRVFGGELKISSGAFQHDPTSATHPALDDDTLPNPPDPDAEDLPDPGGPVNVVSALFGSFDVDTSTTPNTVSQHSPVNDIEYGSEISASNSSEVGFRKRLLGPDLSVNTEIGSTNSITRYAERLVNKQSSDFAEIDNSLGNEENFKKTLEKQFSNQFGVNIDEELSRLIVQQNAFSASSRAISTVNQLFDELLNAVR